MVRIPITYENFLEQYIFLNGENYKTHMIDLYKGGLKLSDIATKNVGENDLNHRMNYIMIRIENLDKTLLQEV